MKPTKTSSNTNASASSTVKLPSLFDKRKAPVSSTAVSPRKKVDLVALGIVPPTDAEPADRIQLVSQEKRSLGGGLYENDGDDWVKQPTKPVGSRNTKKFPQTARAAPTTSVSSMVSEKAESVANWPSSASNKPALLLHLERYMKDHIQTVGQAAEAGMNSNDLCNLRLAAVLDCTKLFCRTFRVYHEVFEAFESLVNLVADSTQNLQAQHMTLQHEFTSVSTLATNLTDQNFTMKRRFDEEIEAKNQHIADVEQRMITDPSVAQQQLAQLRRIVEEGRKRIQTLQKRDDEISSALVGRSLALDDIEGKLYDVENQKRELEHTIQEMEDEKRKFMCKMELTMLEAERSVSVRDAQIRNLEDDLVRARNSIGEEIQKRKQLQTVHTGLQRRATRADYIEYDWEQVCKSKEDPKMWTLDEEGNPELYFMDMSTSEKITHLVKLWRDSEAERKQVDASATQVALSAFLFARPPEDVIGSSSFTKLNGSGTASSPTIVSPPTEMRFVPLSPDALLVNDLNHSMNKSLINKGLLPKCLTWTNTGVVIGSRLNASEVHSYMKSFFDFAQTALRENPRIQASECFDSWMCTKHVLSFAKRVSAAYSLLNAVHNLDESEATIETIMFLSFLAEDVPFDALIHIEQAVEDVAELLERKQGSFNSVTRTLLRTVLKKHFTAMSKEDLDDMFGVVDTHFEVGHDQIAVDQLIIPDGAFFSFLRRYTLSSIVGHQQHLMAAVAAINSGENEERCAPLSTIFALLQECDPDKPYPKHEADCNKCCGWNLDGTTEYTMESLVNIDEFVQSLKKWTVLRVSPRVVAPYPGVKTFPYSVTALAQPSSHTSPEGSFRRQNSEMGSMNLGRSKRKQSMRKMKRTSSQVKSDA